MAIEKKTFSDAINTSKKILKHGDLRSMDLGSLFEIYKLQEQEDIYDTFSGENADVIKQVISVINTATNEIACMYLDILKEGKSGILSVLLDDILNSGHKFEQLLKDPHSLLPDDLKIDDSEDINILNKILVDKIKYELNNIEDKDYDNLDIKNILILLNGLKSVNIEDEIKKKMEQTFLNILTGKISSEFNELISDFENNVNEAIKHINSKFDARLYKNKFSELVRNLEDKEISRGSQGEDILHQCKLNFESQFDEYLSQLIKLIITSKLGEELESLESEGDIDKYLQKSVGTVYADIVNLLYEINDETKRNELEKLLNKQIKVYRSLSQSLTVRKFVDDEGNEYALFKNEEFPVSKHKKVSHRWVMEPKMLKNGNVMITFKDLTTGTVITPDEMKRLRPDNPYEISVAEWKDLQKKIQESRKLSKDITSLKEKIKSVTDETERQAPQEKLKEYMEKIPFYLKVLDNLKVIEGALGDYVEDKIPDFDPNTIKITPDIMENLREMAECAKTMLLGQKDALIIEGEAGVGKNVLIDIFAHFTNRPVFVFACGKKTDSHDLIYQWVLDENGSKKLNSKIYEAIHTPGAILVLDEINTLDAGVIKMLNGLFDKRKTLVSPEEGGKDTRALPDVLLFGTMNPVGYGGTQQLPQDVDSRFHHIIHDYDRLFDKDGVISYSDALRTYGNVNYFWKLVAGNCMTKEDIELYEQALLDKKMGNKLSKKKQMILDTFKPISDPDFIWAWNNLFNGGNEDEVKDKFGDTFVEGMKDIYTIVLYANYIRMRYKISQLDVESDNLPRDEDTNDLFDEKSFSPRLVIQALEQLNNGNEISDAKQAVIQTYVQQISNEGIRTKIIKFFDTMSLNKLEENLKNNEVQKLLFK